MSARCPAAFENELRSYVRGGGSVLIALGHRSVASAKVPVSDDRIEEARYSGREGALFQAAAWLDPSHPSILKDDRWDDVKFYQAIRIDPGKARVVARLTDQTPLLLDQQVGGGHILVFASTFDNVANDFPLHASFVPFVEQTARYLGRLDAEPSSVPVGSFGELRDSKETGAAVDVVDPKGDRVLSLAEATKAHQHPVHPGGFLRHTAAQRPQRTGGRQYGPPRIRSRPDPPGDPLVVAEYSQRDFRERWGSFANRAEAAFALVVRDGGGVGCLRWLSRC